MSKYIIELDDRIKLVTSVGVTENGVVYTTSDYVHNLEELNSDYINEHYGSLQDDAYHRGLAEGKKAFDLLDAERNAEYQRGLDDAWEAARKIIHMPEGELLNIFTECYSAVCTALQAILKYDASEAIEKLKAYEEKQNDKIKVGDEVEHSVECFVVTVANDKYVYGISKDGTWCYASVKNVHKTGRHFDIASILEDMRND